MSRITSSRRGPPTQSRPISSHKGAGYVSGGPSSSKDALNPLDKALDSYTNFIKQKEEEPETVVKKFKEKLTQYIEESSQLFREQKKDQALAKAKLAETELKQMDEYIKTKQFDDTDSKTFKFSVLMQLGDCFVKNEMYEEALHQYQKLQKDREFKNQYITHLGIGNVYFAQGKFDEAIKYYQMGINHIDNKSQKYEARFHHCCGVASVKLHQFPKALGSFEAAMRLDPSIKTGLNLVLCHVATMSPITDLREAYSRLLSVKSYTSHKESDASDVLGNHLVATRKEEVRMIMLASRIVSSKSEQDWQEGYEFVLSKLKASKYPEAEGEFEIAYALAHLSHKNTSTAIEMLRKLHKKDPALKAHASTNLSFLYFIEQKFDEANDSATMALEYDKYVPQALVNKGNCLLRAGKEEEAKSYYLEAVGVDANCVEALYNLGLVSKLLGQSEDALQVFFKLNSLINKAPEVVYQIADCYLQADQISHAIDWFHRLLTILPTDPSIWKKIGLVWTRNDNEGQAYQCYLESYKFNPMDIDVITWLGSYFFHKSDYETALKYFQRGASLQPKDFRHLLMVALCYNKSGEKQEALKVYEYVAQADPCNKMCLESLVRLCSEMGYTNKAEHYQNLYHDLLDRMAQVEAQQEQTSPYPAPAYPSASNIGPDVDSVGMPSTKPSTLRMNDLDSGAASMSRINAGAADRDLFDKFDIDLPDSDGT